MKRNIITIMMALAALLMAQCKKQAEQQANEPAGATMDVTVRVQGNTEKTDITSTGVVTWKQGDKLYVVGEDQGLLGYVSARADGDPVTFTGMITALTSAQTLRFYYVGAREFTLDGSGNCTFDISGQDGSLAGIAANNQLMWGKTTSTIAVGSIDFGTITMTSLMSIAHLNIKDGDAAVSGPVTVTGGFATSTFNAKTYGGTTLSGTAGNITMTLASGTTSTDCYMALLPGSQTLKFSADGKEATLSEKDIAANTFYNSGSAVEVTLEAAAPTFSVGEHTTVEFSPGNLYYNGADESHKMNSNLPSGWNFYGHQWDCYSSETSSVTESMEISLFTWGYGTWSTDYSTADYQMDLVVTMVDWGTAPGLPGAGEGKSWRTLKKDEWVYLLNKSNVSSGARIDVNRFAKAKVSEVVGLLVFPDGYELPEGYTTADGGTGMAKVNNTDAEYPTVSILDATWTSMESAGVVFLPAAGIRYATSVYDVGSHGHYWSSSSYESGGAYHLSFDSESVYPGRLDDCLSGFSVRLVSEN